MIRLVFECIRAHCMVHPCAIGLSIMDMVSPDTPTSTSTSAPTNTPPTPPPTSAHSTFDSYDYVLAQAETLLHDLRFERNPEQPCVDLKNPITKRSQGRPGKGISNDYEAFCSHCFLEFGTNSSSNAWNAAIETLESELKSQSQSQSESELKTQSQSQTQSELKTFHNEKCNKCGHSLITKHERHEQIRMKVNELKEKKLERKIKRQHYERLKEKAHNANTLHNQYQAWDVFEPESDQEQEQEQQQFDQTIKQNETLKMMEKDMLERAERKRQRAKEAETHKEEGNRHMMEQNYAKAIQCYQKAIEWRKDDKTLYANRALAYLHVLEFEKCIKDCSTVLEIHHYLDDGKPKNSKVACKALLRRSTALRHVGKIDEALQDAQQAMMMCSGESMQNERKEAMKCLEAAQHAQTHNEIAMSQKATDIREIVEQVSTCIEEMKQNEHKSVTHFEQRLSSLHHALMVPHCLAQFISEFHGASMMCAVLDGALKCSNAKIVGLVLRFCASTLTSPEAKDALIRGGAFRLIESALADLNMNTIEEDGWAVLAAVCDRELCRLALEVDAKRTYELIQKGLQTPNSSMRISVLTVLCNCLYDASFKMFARKADPPVSTLLSSQLRNDPAAYFCMPMHHSELSIASLTLSALSNLTVDRAMRLSLSENQSCITLLRLLLLNSIEYLSRSDAMLQPELVDLAERAFTLSSNLAHEHQLLTTLYEGTNYELPTRLRRLLLSNPKLPTGLATVVSACALAALRIPNVLEDAAHDISFCSWLFNVAGYIHIGKTGVVCNTTLYSCTPANTPTVLLEHSIKGIALLTGSNRKDDENIRNTLLNMQFYGIDEPFGIDTILNSALSHSSQLIRGNACLCIASLARTKSALSRFRKTIPRLIEIMKDSADSGCHNNASIAAARLASDPENLLQIRQYRGIEIMMALNSNNRR